MLVFQSSFLVRKFPQLPSEIPKWEQQLSESLEPAQPCTAHALKGKTCPRTSLKDFFTSTNGCQCAMGLRGYASISFQWSLPSPSALTPTRQTPIISLWPTLKNSRKATGLSLLFIHQLLLRVRTFDFSDRTMVCRTSEWQRGAQHSLKKML